jgi:hypothetical protein
LYNDSEREAARKPRSRGDYTEIIKITNIDQTPEGDAQQIKLDKGEYPL